MLTVFGLRHADRSLYIVIHSVFEILLPFLFLFDQGDRHALWCILDGSQAVLHLRILGPGLVGPFLLRGHRLKIRERDSTFAASFLHSLHDAWRETRNDRETHATSWRMDGNKEGKILTAHSSPHATETSFQPPGKARPLASSLFRKSFMKKKKAFCGCFLGGIFASYLVQPRLQLCPKYSSCNRLSALLFAKVQFQDRLIETCQGVKDSRWQSSVKTLPSRLYHMHYAICNCNIFRRCEELTTEQTVQTAYKMDINNNAACGRDSQRLWWAKTVLSFITNISLTSGHCLKLIANHDHSSSRKRI